MTDLGRDLRYASIMAGDLKDYLLSDILYMQLGQGGLFSAPLPFGTLGGLMLRLRRLDLLRDRLSPEQYSQLDAAREKVNAEMDHWKVQAEQKMVREIKARFQTWSTFLDDCAGDATRYQNEYPTQVENRLIIDMLMERAGKAADGNNFRQQLEILDRQLHSFSGEGPFVWDEELSSAYPRSTHWYLWLKLKKI
jgi:hypothetical protein